MSCRRLARLAALVLLAGAFALPPGCKRQGGDPQAKAGAGRAGPPAFPVETQPVEARRVEYVVSAVGTVAAFEEIQVTARVAGVVERLRFQEGQLVAAGDVLVEIEPARYRLAVDAAKATLEKAKAAQADAEAGLARRERAVAERPGLVPGEELESFRTRVRTAAAEATQARVALAKAELDLRDAYVRAPAPGVIQTRTVQTGQYAQPGLVLATLVRREPLLLRFEVSERDASRIAPGQAVRFRVRGEEAERTARLSHVAAAAREDSRMVAITAEVDDPRRAELRAGAFAEVTVPVGGADEGLVVPQTAIRPSERGFLAYVVEDGVARERVLRLGMRTADGKVEVQAGLARGEALVVRGAEALRDGAKVRAGGGGAPGGGAGGAPGGGAGGAPR